MNIRTQTRNETYVGEALEGQHLGGLLGEGAEAAPLLLEREPRVVPPQEAQGVAHLFLSLCFVLVVLVGGCRVGILWGAVSEFVRTWEGSACLLTWKVSRSRSTASRNRSRTLYTRT